MYVRPNAAALPPVILQVSHTISATPRAHKQVEGVSYLLHKPAICPSFLPSLSPPRGPSSFFVSLSHWIPTDTAVLTYDDDDLRLCFDELDSGSPLLSSCFAIKLLCSTVPRCPFFRPLRRAHPPLSLFFLLSTFYILCSLFSLYPVLPLLSKSLFLSSLHFYYYQYSYRRCLFSCFGRYTSWLQLRRRRPGDPCPPNHHNHRLTRPSTLPISCRCNGTE